MVALPFRYTDFPPGSGEPAFLRGLWPSKIHFRVSRWSASEMPPPTDDAALAAWVKARWKEKEALLKTFSDSSGATMAEPGGTSDPRGGRTEGPTALPMDWDGFVLYGSRAPLRRRL